MIGDLYAIPLPTGYGACQVTGDGVVCRSGLGALPSLRSGALRTFVETLDRIDGRYQMIDTMRREQAADAFLDLAVRAGIPVAEAEEWFDEWRDF
jgi:hypothetical protein